MVLNIKDHNFFLTDAIGALVPMVFLGILYYIQSFIGMSGETTFINIANILLIYSFTIYFTKPKNWSMYLYIIAAIHILYCMFQAIHIWENSNSITTIGFLYFASEIIIILMLST